MAHQSIWYTTSMPDQLIDILCEDIKSFDESVESSTIGDDFEVNSKIRLSKNSWVPVNHWIHSLVWSYVDNANKINFQYDIEGFDHERIQYTHYKEGDFYSWHQDDSIANNHLRPRKLSIVVQQSDPEDYEGGNLELLGAFDQKYLAPRTKGTIIVFDSRTRHRVTKVRSGYRRSLVGWVVGPKWK